MRLWGLSGRANPAALARLLGLLPSVFSRCGIGPNDNLLMPDVDNLLTCFIDDGVSSAAEEFALTVLPPVRFLLRIVTLGGMYEWLAVEELRGDARGGVWIGAGSFDLAD